MPPSWLQLSGIHHFYGSALNINQVMGIKTSLLKLILNEINLEVIIGIEK